MQAEAVQDPHLVRAQVSLERAVLEEHHHQLVPAVLPEASCMTVATALATLMVAVEVVALITFEVGKVAHLEVVVVQDLPALVHQIPEALTQTLFTVLVEMVVEDKLDLLML
jgi:hypothetical protein